MQSFGKVADRRKYILEVAAFRSEPDTGDYFKRNFTEIGSKILRLRGANDSGVVNNTKD